MAHTKMFEEDLEERKMLNEMQVYTASGIQFKYNYHRSKCLTLITYAESLRITLRFVLLLNNSTALSMAQNLSIITDTFFCSTFKSKRFSALLQFTRNRFLMHTCIFNTLLV